MSAGERSRRGRVPAREVSIAVAGVVLSLAAPSAGGAQVARPAVVCVANPLAGRDAADGWRQLRRDSVAAAAASFARARRGCPDWPEANTGAGYVAMRRGDLRAARASFDRALAVLPRSYDALTGRGMLAYREGDQATARRLFERALAEVPGDSTARWYLARLGPTVDSTRLPARPRAPRLVVAARTAPRRFEVPDGRGGWRPMWLKAVNLGAALPGRHPAEFPPNDGTYDRWIALIDSMGGNAIRVYTIHPPHFYEALASWNRRHPDRPLWLVHGVWTELPPGRDEERYDDPAWKSGFVAEMRRVVDVVHGRAAIAPVPGHAAGMYTADLSRWTLAYIIGREWEPYSVAAFARAHPKRTAYRGTYVSATGGNTMDAWLAEVSDSMVRYETERYNTQRPLAYTNWPTLDPLRHPTEATLEEENRLRAARGEPASDGPHEYDNDGIGLDATRTRAEPAYPAGVFASFHAYPYYPDFMLLDPGYARARGPDGPSRYYGYLRELVEHHGSMPVVISEFGVPSSRGVAHLHPEGWHHGGHSEAAQAEIDARMTREIYAAGAAGAGFFALIDEWFKKNWVVIDFEQPLERKPLWLNALDAEEHYGAIAMRAGARDSVIVIDGNATDWGTRGRWYVGDGAAGASLPRALQLRALSVVHDPAYLYLRLDVGRVDWSAARYLIGISTVGDQLGDRRLPYTGAASPVGLEFVLDLHGPSGSHLLVDRPYNPYRAAPIAGSRPTTTMQVYNTPFRSVPNDDGRYDSVFVATNRRRLGRDGTVYPERGYDRSALLHGRQQQTSLADWFADTARGTIEVRIPWGMLHVLDPSSRRVLEGESPSHTPQGVEVPGFRFVVQSFDPRRPGAPGDRLPRSSGSNASSLPPLWTWPKWESPTWHAELKPVFGAMRAAFRAIPDSAPPPGRRRAP